MTHKFLNISLHTCEEGGVGIQTGAAGDQQQQISFYSTSCLCDIQEARCY